MDRKAQGGLLLTVALVGLLTGAGLLNPHTVDGLAAAVPPDGAPAVGTCLAHSVTSSWDASGTLRPAATDYVPCDRPHRAEVFAVVDPLPALASGTVFDLCAGDDRVTGYLGVDRDGSGWQPEISVRATASGPDARQVSFGQDWAACVLVKDLGPPLTRPLGGAATSHTVPPQVGVCFDGSVADLGVRSPVSCTEPHDGEVFARRTVDGSDALADLTRSCRALVDAGTGRAVSRRDPALVVEAALVASDRVPDAVTARCLVRSGDDRRLTASLRGLGEAPLPWAD